MRTTVNVNKRWVFSKKFRDVPKTAVPRDWNDVDLPHTWNNVDGQDGGNDYYRGRCCYAKKLSKSDLPVADRYFLEIKGANSGAKVYLNGKLCAKHDGGYSLWRADITDLMQNENILAVTVDNSPSDKVYPQSADFTFYGGLYRDVNIVCVNNAHFSLEYYGGNGIKITPKADLSRAAFRDGKLYAPAEIEITSYPVNGEGCSVKYVVKDADGNPDAEAECNPDAEGDGNPVEEGDGAPTTAVITLESARLWNGKDDPYLYSLEAYIVREGEILDGVCTRFGIRTFGIDAENGFMLNGRSYPLRGVSRHQDWLGIGNALLPEHHIKDIDLICELGANAVRLAHYQHDELFYSLCDERGIVVWAEIPYISAHMPSARNNTISQLTELIVQNYNHPSVAVWSLSNEITIKGSTDDLLENHRILNDLAHKLDPTRKTVVAAVSTCGKDQPYIHIPDAVCYNHYFGWYGGTYDMYAPWFDSFHREYPDIPIGISEYGCEALNWHSSDPIQGDYTEEYQARYHEEVIKQLFPKRYIWATFVWNMFDFGADNRDEGGEAGQNHKGLVTFDRKYKKDSFYAYKAWLSDEPFVHICGKRYSERVEDLTEVTVYTNLDEVELFANGKSLGRKRNNYHFYRFRVPNQGETVLKAVAGKCTDESRIVKVDKFNETYRFTPSGAVLNWFDVTERDGYLSLNSQVKDVVAVPQGRQLLEGFLKAGTEGKELLFDLQTLIAMASEFTLLRLSGMCGTANITITKEQLLKLNEELNKIEKAK
ncbi:MAG: glycoside hydrolase family 2 TIM barrel-domain containing protein [Candidatus Coproplasma sp.]